MGGALHREMADSAHGKRWGTDSAEARNPSGGRDQPYTLQSLPALCFRSLDDEGASPAPVVSVCRRWARALSEQARSGSRDGQAASPARGVRPRNASDQNENRLLQGRTSKANSSERHI